MANIIGRSEQSKQMRLEAEAARRLAVLQASIADWADTNAMAIMTQRNPWTGRMEGRLSPQFLGMRPVCSWCETPVSRFTDYFDENTRQFKFRFECHGREEIVPIDKEFVERNRDDFKKWLSNYRPFGGDADKQIMTDQNGSTVAVAYIPKGAPVVRAPGGGIMPLRPGESYSYAPLPDRPSSKYLEFTEKIISDMANKVGIPPDSMWRPFSVDPYAFVVADEVEQPVPQSRPQPKVEDFLLPARKPRIITLENQ